MVLCITGEGCPLALMCFRFAFSQFAILTMPLLNDFEIKLFYIASSDVALKLFIHAVVCLWGCGGAWHLPMCTEPQESWACCRRFCIPHSFFCDHCLFIVGKLIATPLPPPEDKCLGTYLHIYRVCLKSSMILVFIKRFYFSRANCVVKFGSRFTTVTVLGTTRSVQIGPAAI